MTSAPPPNNSGFDAYAAEYDAVLAQGLAISGEDKTYFINGRIRWLAQCLRQLKAHPASVLDFGCGTGAAASVFHEQLAIQSLIGIDVSDKSLAIARQTCTAQWAQFVSLRHYQPSAQLDLAFCNGVFHHIPLAERAAAVDCVYRSLRPGGLFAFWENNPWNPGTRYIMHRVPFDRDAQTLAPPQARRLLRAGKFEIVRTDFLFIFPRALCWFRGLEPLVARLPFGAQYQVLCRKP